ncbi:MAG: glycosyltransferase family 9 protein, partial [Verrucomicrobiota bacterium]
MKNTRAFPSGGKRILVRGVNWLGDAVMTTPALQRLRELCPDARIVLLTHQKLADIWNAHPAIDGIVSFSPGESPWRIAARLRPEQFDLALVFPNSVRSALEVFLARIPSRIGYAGSWRRCFLTHPVSRRPEMRVMRKRSRREIENRIRQQTVHPTQLPTEAAPPHPMAQSMSHQMHEYLHLVGHLGGNVEPLAPFLQVESSAVEEARNRFQIAKDRPLFGLNPGAEYGPAKRWPAEKFIQVATTLHLKTGCQWLLFGGTGDRALAEQIAGAVESKLSKELAGKRSDSPVVNLAGRTSLRDLCALIRSCRVFLTNDTGPMHVAAA